MSETNFFWDLLSDNILQERDETGAVTAEYTTEPGLYGNLISQNRQGVESQHHFDALGSTQALTDDNQQVADTNAYSAFGEMTEQSGSTVNPFKYGGQKEYYQDEVTGQYLVRRRPYSVAKSRWLTRDVVISIGELNLYRYAANCPMLFVDPSGKDFIALAHFELLPDTFHYSLEKWECYESCTLVSECQQYDLPRDFPYVANCNLKAWIELGGFDIEAPADGRRLLPPRRVESVWVPLALVRFNRPDHGPIPAIMPILVGTREEVNSKWTEIVGNAANYEWAEQEFFEGVVLNWPRSVYYAVGTNSRTFVREMVRLAHLRWCEMTGTHLGRDTPAQNTLIGFPVPTHTLVLPQDPPSQIRKTGGQ